MRRAWVYLVTLAVLGSTGGYIAKLRLSDIPNQAIGHSSKPPLLGRPQEKIVGYEVVGPAGAQSTLSYLDANGGVRRITTTLPWQKTVRTDRLTLPTGVVAQTTGEQVSCRITINGEQRDQHFVTAQNAAVSCTVPVS